ncbi:MAG: hypothetical protein RLO11_12700, partial [Salinisphaeraceae bacterium]
MITKPASAGFFIDDESINVSSFAETKIGRFRPADADRVTFLCDKKVTKETLPAGESCLERGSRQDALCASVGEGVFRRVIRDPTKTARTS